MSDDERPIERRRESRGAPPPHGSLAAPADALRAEWELDYLVQLAARAEMRREDSPFYRDTALVEWIDEESRAPERAAAGWSAEQVARVAERVRARAEAARLGVVTNQSPAPLHAAGVACGGASTPRATCQRMKAMAARRNGRW